MGKRQKKPSPPIPIRQFPIAKSKSFTHNLNQFIRHLQEHHKYLSSKEFLAEVHCFVNRYRSKSNRRDLQLATARQKVKICSSCQGWCGNKTMLQCALCEDFHHQECLADPEAFVEDGLCPNCVDNKLNTFDRDAYLNDLLQDRCFKCEEQRKDREAFVHCMRCAHRFHKKCYGRSVAVCSQCKRDIDDQVRSKQSVRQATLDEYPAAATPPRPSCPPPRTSISEPTPSPRLDKEKDESTRASLLGRSEPDLFSSTVGTELDEEEVEYYREGLMFAVLAKNMNYTQELYPIDCSLDIVNEESLDFGLDHMSRAEEEAYRSYKKQPIGPYRFVFKQGMGYDVVADMDIPQKTLICEYVGEVVTLRRCIELEAHSKNDSLMELRVGYNSEETLIIRPQKHTNMARFINGINNSKGSGRANVATVRKLARGIPTVILYSIKGIKRGESLLYDYNAGSTTCSYDTSAFI